MKGASLLGLILATSLALVAEVQAQQGNPNYYGVIRNPIPSNSVLWPCANGIPVKNETQRVYYQMPNTRAYSPEPGEFRLYYLPTTVLTSNQTESVFDGVCQSAGVQVSPLFGDMGVWAMRQAGGRETMWVAECYRQQMELYWLRPMMVLGAFSQLEPPPDCEDVVWSSVVVTSNDGRTTASLDDFCDPDAGSGQTGGVDLSGWGHEELAVLFDFLHDGSCTPGWIILVDMEVVCDGT